MQSLTRLSYRVRLFRLAPFVWVQRALVAVISRQNFGPHGLYTREFACLYGCISYLPLWLYPLLAVTAVYFACLYSCDLRLPLRLRPSLVFTAATIACLYGCAFACPYSCDSRLPLRLRLVLASMAAFNACLNGCLLRLPIQRRPLLTFMTAFSFA